MVSNHFLVENYNIHNDGKVKGLYNSIEIIEFDGWMVQQYHYINWKKRPVICFNQFIKLLSIVSITNLRP